MKKRCAKEALKFVPEHGIIGLGGGSTIAYLAEYISVERPEVSVVTPSMDTKKLCERLGVTVLLTEEVSKIKIAFDGCDQVDHQLNAYKSAGGIHTKEKIIGKMAEEYMLLVDENKVVPELSYDFPVVLEIVPEAKGYLASKLTKMNMTYQMRTPELMEVFIKDSKMDMGEIDNILKGFTGVIETSLFYEVAAKALVVTQNGSYVIEKEKKNG
ncbi:MAG: ribose 5-phosphate isomerase A [Anaerostipes sp.]|nr:ribose 5-phosphate isomerase A [Anaerostipes sp.]